MLVTTWRGVQFASLAHSFAAPQPVDLTALPVPGGTAGSAPLQRLHAARPLGAATSPDCLFLNVFAPKGAADLPVVLYFFGGGFEAGAASEASIDGAHLAQLGPCIFVAANYRLGAYGFAHFHTLSDQLTDAHNLGLQDAIAALHWVRKFIHLFGGDPHRVTLMGGSSGAFLATALAVARGVAPSKPSPASRAARHASSPKKTRCASARTSFAPSAARRPARPF
ncbi:carboxylesterase family protein [Microbacterium rhizosphaerae]|uniref:Carboxylic ester hydrolase n=1 Tax=Microbacterium rhizosphaerae TaxID=1678237 RepID=A0ABZ0SMC9_9MICO|nr:carboxylesterase family protein [Microbacterium rhizosphaerae]WPR89359.1 carboxylesterase family protein [Microbacterium rhizosphaerae]